jgi:hypothetical protein
MKRGTVLGEDLSLTRQVLKLGRKAARKNDVPVQANRNQAVRLRMKPLSQLHLPTFLTACGSCSCRSLI